MAIDDIRFYRTNVKGRKPSASNLAEGELALNLKDRLIFSKDSDGNIVTLGNTKEYTVLYTHFEDRLYPTRTFENKVKLLSYSQCAEYDYIVIKNPWIYIGGGYQSPKTIYADEVIVDLKLLWENRNQYHYLHNKNVYATQLLFSYTGLTSAFGGIMENYGCMLSIFLTLSSRVENNEDINNTDLSIFNLYEMLIGTMSMGTPFGFDAIYGVKSPSYRSSIAQYDDVGTISLQTL